MFKLQRNKPIFLTLTTLLIFFIVVNSTFKRYKKYRYVREYKKLIKSGETSSFNYSQLGVAYLFLRKYDKAVENCKKAVELSPEGYDIRYNLATVYAVKAFITKEDTWCRKALEELVHTKELLAKSDNNSDNYYYGIGGFFEKLDDYVNALECYKSAIRFYDANRIFKLCKENYPKADEKLYSEIVNYRREIIKAYVRVKTKIWKTLLKPEE